MILTSASLRENVFRMALVEGQRNFRSHYYEKVKNAISKKNTFLNPGWVPRCWREKVPGFTSRRETSWPCQDSELLPQISTPLYIQNPGDPQVTKQTNWVLPGKLVKIKWHTGVEALSWHFATLHLLRGIRLAAEIWTIQWERKVEFPYRPTLRQFKLHTEGPSLWRKSSVRILLPRRGQLWYVPIKNWRYLGIVLLRCGYSRRGGWGLT